MKQKCGGLHLSTLAYRLKAFFFCEYAYKEREEICSKRISDQKRDIYAYKVAPRSFEKDASRDARGTSGT